MNQQLSDNNQNPNEGVDLGQVVDFLSEHWKKAAVGAVAGAVIGVAGWSVLASYKAETVLVNSVVSNSNSNSNSEQRAINFISWRVLQKNLPILASQKESGWSALESASWWQKNVVPTYSLSKADTKDLASISKELQDSEGQTILSLTVNANGSTKEKALSRLDELTRFIREGSVYLLLKGQVIGYEAKLLNSDADLQKRITDTEVELKFLRDRARNLESLRQRFPQNVAVASQQIVDLKDSNAKFMPISTQLVAVNTDINNAEESLKRMHEQQAQMKVLNEFVTQARSLLDKESNGLRLADGLLQIETEMRKAAKPEDIVTQQILNDIRAQVVQVQARFTKGLESGSAPYVSRPGPVLPAVGGLLGGAFAGLLYAMTRMVLAKLKSRVRRLV